MPIVDCIDDFFEPITNFNKDPSKLIDGQVAWVPVLIPRPLPWVMDARRKSGRDHNNIKYEIRKIRESDFLKKSDRLPIHRMNLHPTEELLAIKAKKRPCIMISQYLIMNGGKIKNITEGKEHLLQQEQVFLPIFSTQGEESSSGFPQGFVRNIRKMAYPHLLYFPGTISSKYRGRGLESL